MIKPFLLIAALFLTACAGPASKGGGDILVLGDSVMAWNSRSNAAIGDALQQQLGRTVVSRAVSGAQFDNGSVLASAVGFNIQQQFPGGKWNWIVLDGGANDLGYDDCGCGDCLHVVDRLISKSTNTGAIPGFLDGLRTSGARVIWMGYYHSPGSSFKGCRDDLVEMERRIARRAATDPDLTYVDGETVINKSDLSHFSSDATHPSPKGSALLAELIGRVITSSQTGR